MYLEALASGGGSDWFYTVILKAPLGSAITLDDGDEEVNAVGTGDYIGIPVHNASSTYAITVEANGFQRTGTVTSGATSGGMSSLLDYSFGEIDLTIDPDFNGVNATVTDGTSTATVALPATGTSAVIYVPNTGNWTISATDPGTGISYDSIPNPVVVSALGTAVTAELLTIPSGATATPTDSIQMWLLCGGIRDKSYTTLGEVLADEDTLRKLLTSDNANDYLVRSKTWAVATGLVPTMSGPSGNEDASSIYDSTTPAWKAFDKQSNTWWNSATSGLPAWLSYDFGSPVIVGRVGVVNLNSSYGAGTVYIEAKNDGDAGWTKVSSDVVLGNSDLNEQFISINDLSEYRYWRLYILNTKGASSVSIPELQFYTCSIPTSELAMSYIGQDDYAANTLLGDSDWGQAILDSEYRELVFNVQNPTMTSDTAPKGVASCSSTQTNYAAYKAFDGITTDTPSSSNAWATAARTVIGWLAYEFESAKKIKGIVLTPRQNPNGGQEQNVQTATIEYSDDGSSWTPDASGLQTYNKYSVTNKILQENSAHKHWRINAASNYGSTDCVAICELKFYGRETSGVQTLLKLAGVTNKPYLTIEEVLADHETVQKIMHSHDAVDYLATAKLFIDAVTNDAFAMRCIGLRNYAANTLLADEDWCAGITGSDYCESVLQDKVPTMTSDTSPKGLVIYSYQNSTYTAVRAFNATHTWSTGVGGSAPTYIGYIFDTPTILKYVKTTEYGYSSGGMINNFKIQGSNDTTNGRDGTWTDLTDTITITSAGANAPHNFVINNSNSYKAYRLYAASENNGTIGTLQFYGRTDVDETKIQVYSAANDSFSLQDPSTGSLSPLGTTDASGHAELTRITDIANGQHTLYSGVAKNPNKLTDDYFKRVNVDDWTSIIELMPDDALYWWGYRSPELQVMSTGNGWTPNSGYSFGTPTFNTYDVDCSSTSTTSVGVGSSKPIKNAGDDEINVVATGITAGTSTYGFVMDQTAKVLTWNSETNIKSAALAKTTRKVLSSGNYYPEAFAHYGRRSKFSAIWVDNSDIPTFLSAANDVLYILDGARQIPIAITNAEGKSYDPMLAPGTYTIYSSVAKDNLGDPYGKTVTIAADTICVPVMPDKAIYWYGWESDNLEDASTANGYAPYSGYTFVNPTHNVGYISFTSASSTMSGIGCKEIDNSVVKANIIAKGITLVNGSYGELDRSTGKSFAAYDASNRALITGSSTALYSVNLDSTYKIPLFGVATARSAEVYAFWLE